MNPELKDKRNLIGAVTAVTGAVFMFLILFGCPEWFLYVGIILYVIGISILIYVSYFDHRNK